MAVGLFRRFLFNCDVVAGLQPDELKPAYETPFMSGLVIGAGCERNQTGADFNAVEPISEKVDAAIDEVSQCGCVVRADHAEFDD